MKPKLSMAMATVNKTADRMRDILPIECWARFAQLTAFDPPVRYPNRLRQLHMPSIDPTFAFYETPRPPDHRRSRGPCNLNRLWSQSKSPEGACLQERAGGCQSQRLTRSVFFGHHRVKIHLGIRLTSVGACRKMSNSRTSDRCDMLFIGDSGKKN